MALIFGVEWLKICDFIGKVFVTFLVLKTLAVPHVLIKQGIINTYLALHCVFSLDLFGLLMCRKFKDMLKYYQKKKVLTSVLFCKAGTCVVLLKVNGFAS